MGECIEKLPHSCGTRDGLQVFESDDGSYNGWCYSCRSYVDDPYKNKPKGYKPASFRKSAEEIAQEMSEIGDCPTVDLPERRLRAESLEYFGVKIGLSEEDGTTPVTHHYPYTKDGKLVAYKNRVIEGKKMWSTGSQKDVDLFGWEKAASTGAKKLFITEGELDAVALYQMMMDKQKGTKWEEYHPAVVSLPHGASSAGKDMAALAVKAKRLFSEIVLVFDKDAAGKAAVDDVMTRMPEVTVADLPSKDANQCLLDGFSKACVNACLFNSKKPKNTRLVYGGSLREAARQEAEWGLSYPWEGLTQLTRGMRFGETYYWGAGVKMGKSELVNALAAHAILEHGEKVFLAKPEEANRKSYQMLVGKAAKRIFHDPNIPFDYAAYDKAEPLIGDNAVLVDLYQHLGWETLKADIYAAAAEGYRVVFIDPITNLTNSMDSGEANTVLTAVSAELAAMALDLDLAIHIFCHLKAPTNGLPHEMGGKIFSNQFAGSRAMMRSCNYMIGLEGNKDAELPPEERNVRKLVVLEDREFGNVGQVPLYWDMNSGMFNEM